MSLPVSVGDAILLSQIAISIGQAFTSGRKSAPAEFAEIQDLLFTLSGALKLLAKDLPTDTLVQNANSNGIPRDEVDEEAALLSQMVLNCGGTLKHLESVVAKYMIIDGRTAQQPGEKRWKDEVKKNFRKIMWTKEGGDIAKLKVTLTTHINGLNLAVTTICKKHGVAIIDKVAAIDTKLTAIYEWFEENLQGRNAASTPQDGFQHTDRAQSEVDALRFAVSIETSTSQGGRKLLCPSAAFSPGWFDYSNSIEDSESIFACACPSREVRQEHEHNLHTTLLASSVLVSIASSAGPQWHMYASSNPRPNRTSSIYLSNIDPSKLAEFEEQASHLAILQSQRHLLEGRSSGLITISQQAGELAAVSVLATKTSQDQSNDMASPIRLKFHFGGRNFGVTTHSLYSILHYKSSPESTIRTYLDHGFSARSAFIPQPHADIAFRAIDVRTSSQDTTEHNYYITLYHDTRITPGTQPRFAKLNRVMCTSETKHTGTPAEIQQIECDEVDIEFHDATAVSTFLSRAREMQKSLFATYLKSARCGEQIVFQQHRGGTVSIRGHTFREAHLLVVLNLRDEQYRIILRSCEESSFLCIELPNDAIEALTTDAQVSEREYPGYFLHIEPDGTDIVKEVVKLRELKFAGWESSNHMAPLLGGMEELSIQ